MIGGTIYRNSLIGTTSTSGPLNTAGNWIDLCIYGTALSWVIYWGWQQHRAGKQGRKDLSVIDWLKVHGYTIATGAIMVYIGLIAQ